MKKLIIFAAVLASLGTATMSTSQAGSFGPHRVCTAWEVFGGERHCVRWSWFPGNYFPGSYHPPFPHYPYFPRYPYFPHPHHYGF